MDGLCASEGDFVGRQVEDSQSIVLKAKLFDGVYGITVQLIFSEGQFLQSSVDLQHLCEMDRALLSDALVFRCIEAQRPQGGVVPIEDGGDADDSIDVETCIGEVELL